MTRPAILERLRGVQRVGTGWLAFCPAHDDREKRSLSIGVGEDDRTLLKCFARGCSAEQITHAVNMTLADLGPPAGNGSRPERRREVVAYDYRDEASTLLYQVVRYEPKDFRPRRPDGAGGWTWDLKGVRRVVYHLDELVEQERIFLVEGEKDADRVRSLGLVATTTPGGAAGWRDEYAQQIRDAAVIEVVAARDQDDAGLGYIRRAAAGLTRLGVRVRRLDLPGLMEKQDISDWLDAGHGKDELLALAASSPLFSEAAPGREPAADAPAEAVTEPALCREGLDLSLVWSDGVRLSLAAIRDGREGVRGELTVTRSGRRLSWGVWSLSSTVARETLRKKLEAAESGIVWGEHLEDAAWRLTRAAREGEPLVTLTGTVASPTREVVPGLLYEGEPTLIFGDGDVGKSFFAIATAGAVQSGTALPFGLTPARAVPTAYLDWETSRDTLEARVAQLAAGFGIAPPPILYKRMTRPLVDEVAALAVEFARRGVGLVIVDSMMFAVAAGEAAAFHEPITSFYAALRLFAPAATLVLSHVTGEDARRGGPARPFGGAFAFNGPRLIWEAKRDPEITDATAIAFTCRKANNLPRRPEPFGLIFRPEAGAIRVGPFNLTEATPQTVAGAPWTYRVRLALATEDLSAAELGEKLGASEKTIRRTLERLREKGTVVSVPDTKPQAWKLPGA